MQFAVPQFTDVEDKLIGPLSLKQFLIILATGGVIMFFYSIFRFSIFFFFFALPVALAGLSITFGKFNGRPVSGYLGAFFNYASKPKVRVFKREDINLNLSFKTEKIEAPLTEAKSRLEEPSESRLRKLAYLLDQKTEEEKKLLEQKQ
ncbi:MAG: PrgI family protein [Candidatus Doudnabacteria bacterium]|nr:PrgI family protein [Candidatus Doudnabacteria bacterium]